MDTPATYKYNDWHFYALSYRWGWLRWWLAGPAGGAWDQPLVGEMNNFRTGTQLRARTSRVPSSQSTGPRTHTCTRGKEPRRSRAQTHTPSSLHNLGIIYISLRAIISGPGRAHRVSDKFEPASFERPPLAVLPRGARLVATDLASWGNRCLRGRGA